jgi:hypothetical protein
MTGTWHHYAGTYDGTTVSIYLDGVLVASSSYTGGAIALSGNDINIARNPAYGGDFSAGVLADVRLYGRALSASEIRTLFQSPPPPLPPPPPPAPPPAPPPPAPPPPPSPPSPPPPPPSQQAISSISLSGAAFIGGAGSANAVVGTAATTLSPSSPPFAGTWSLSDPMQVALRSIL